MPIILRRKFVLVSLAVATLGLTGCLPGGGLGGASGALAGLSGGGQTAGFAPSGYTPLGGSSPSAPSSFGTVPGSAPASLNQPGSTTQSPTAVLPPPSGSSAQAQQIFAAYGIPINGAGATPTIMDKIADGLRHYKPENTKGLTRITVQSSPGGNLAGMWTSNGQDAYIELMASAQFPEPVSLQTVTHELGHHWSLYADQAAGDAFGRALGTSPAGYVSQYSHNSLDDQIAEAVAVMLIGVPKSEGPPLPGWNPSAQAAQVLQASIITGRPTF